jgi:hypothetical protein
MKREECKGNGMALVAVIELFSARCWFDGYLGGDAAWQAEGRRLAAILREVVGNPFRPVTLDPAWMTWHGGLLVSMAQGMYDSRDFSDMPVLADALEEAGCRDQNVLGHCRSGGEHVRGCWVVDAIIGKS